MEMNINKEIHFDRVHRLGRYSEGKNTHDQ